MNSMNCGRKRKNASDVRAEPIFYEDGPSWRIIDLRPHGVDCMPLLAFGNFGAVRPGADLHVHPGCIEVCLCRKGNVRYETEGAFYPVLPGHVFISRPDEPHRRCDNPKGMMLYRILFKIPKRGGCVMGLSRRESEYVAQTLLRLPFRLFHATTRLAAAFARLFAELDVPKANRLAHHLEMRNAALELLLALIEAPSAPHSAKGRPSQKIKAIAAMMSEHPEKNYPVAKLAAEAALTSLAFTEAFKRHTGLTPHAYLIDQRVRRAADDLAQKRASISFIADKWNFSSPQYMAVAFRRVLGRTPKQIAAKE